MTAKIIVDNNILIDLFKIKDTSNKIGGRKLSGGEIFEHYNGRNKKISDIFFFGSCGSLVVTVSTLCEFLRTKSHKQVNEFIYFNIKHEFLFEHYDCDLDSVIVDLTLPEAFSMALKEILKSDDSVQSIIITNREKISQLKIDRSAALNFLGCGDFNDFEPYLAYIKNDGKTDTLLHRVKFLYAAMTEYGIPALDKKALSKDVNYESDLNFILHVILTGGVGVSADKQLLAKGNLICKKMGLSQLFISPESQSYPVIMNDVSGESSYQLSNEFKLKINPVCRNYLDYYILSRLDYVEPERAMEIIGSCIHDIEMKGYGEWFFYNYDRFYSKNAKDFYFGDSVLATIKIMDHLKDISSWYRVNQMPVSVSYMSSLIDRIPKGLSDVELELNEFIARHQKLHSKACLSATTGAFEIFKSVSMYSLAGVDEKSIEITKFILDSFGCAGFLGQENYHLRDFVELIGDKTFLVEGVENTFIDLVSRNLLPWNLESDMTVESCLLLDGCNAVNLFNGACKNKGLAFSNRILYDGFIYLNSSICIHDSEIKEKCLRYLSACANEIEWNVLSSKRNKLDCYKNIVAVLSFSSRRAYMEGINTGGSFQDGSLKSISKSAFLFVECIIENKPYKDFSKSVGELMQGIKNIMPDDSQIQNLEQFMLTHLVYSPILKLYVDEVDVRIIVDAGSKAVRALCPYEEKFKNFDYSSLAISIIHTVVDCSEIEVNLEIPMVRPLVFGRIDLADYEQIEKFKSNEDGIDFRVVLDGENYNCDSNCIGNVKMREQIIISLELKELSLAEVFDLLN